MLVHHPGGSGLDGGELPAALGRGYGNDIYRTLRQTYRGMTLGAIHISLTYALV